MDFGIIAGAVFVIYHLHYFIYTVTKYAESPGGAELHSWAVAVVFAVAYVASRAASSLCNAKDRRRSSGSNGSAGSRNTQAANPNRPLSKLSLSGIRRHIRAKRKAALLIGIFVMSMAYLLSLACGPDCQLASQAQPTLLPSQNTADCVGDDPERRYCGLDDMPPQSDDSFVGRIDADTVYIASATILALTSFGSIVGVRISSERETARVQAGGITLMLGSVMAIVFVQVWVMITACCGELAQSGYKCAMMGTAVLLICVLLGHAAVVGAQIEESKSGGKHVDIADGAEAGYPPTGSN